MSSQWWYFWFPPLFVFNGEIMLLSHCCKYWGFGFGFGWEGEGGGCVGFAWGVKGAFGVGIAPIKS